MNGLSAQQIEQEIWINFKLNSWSLRNDLWREKKTFKNYHRLFWFQSSEMFRFRMFFFWWMECFGEKIVTFSKQLLLNTIVVWCGWPSVSLATVLSRNSDSLAPKWLNTESEIGSQCVVYVYNVCQALDERENNSRVCNSITFSPNYLPASSCMFHSSVFCFGIIIFFVFIAVCCKIEMNFFACDVSTPLE